jgi:hypothetical protein
MLFAPKKRFNHGIIGAYHSTLAGTLFLGRLTLNITRVISSDLIPQCSAYQEFIQILVVTAVEDAVIRTCMYLLNL